HGAGWPCILWGVLHGIVSSITRLVKKQDQIHIKPIGLIITFIFVNIRWVFFRAESIPVA
ncbi:MAG: MBOAT family protein, partial [Ruminiclostridium sp.]|nr:MBOAT family protein [Ruminiclostridium sp.]